MKLKLTELETARRLSTSPSFLRLADSLLTNLDRATLSEILAGYLFLKARGGSDKDFALYLVTTEPGKMIRISMRILSTVIQDFLLDGEFRSLVIEAFINSHKS